MFPLSPLKLLSKWGLASPTTTVCTQERLGTQWLLSPLSRTTQLPRSQLKGGPTIPGDCSSVRESV